METTLYNQNAEKVGSIKLPESVFNVPMNADLLYEVVTSQRANQRQTLAHAKTRAEVRGGGKKPWQQKGTGRARHGSIRSPIWKGGGVAHGPLKDKIFKKKINKQVARKALSIALSSKAHDGQMVVVDSIALKEAKTKLMAATLNVLGGLFPKFRVSKKSPSRVLVVVPPSESALRTSAQNLPNVEVVEARNMNALQVMSFPYVLFLKDSVEALSAQK